MISRNVNSRLSYVRKNYIMHRMVIKKVRKLVHPIVNEIYSRIVGLVLEIQQLLMD